MALNPHPLAGNFSGRKNLAASCQQDAHTQLDLFVSAPEARDPLIGLVVKLPDACRCGANTARIGPPAGPHLAELRCTTCELHRGWLPRAAHQFLTEVVNRFGFPTTPIAIRRGSTQQREQN
jgi:hypothetical protein